MSGVLLAGLTDREAAATEILIGMHWPRRRVVTIARTNTLSVPGQGSDARACGHCVIDLFGLGMRRHSADNEARLLAFLDGRPAVLLIWGSGGGWLESPLGRGDAPRLAWINLHYTSAQMLDALRSIGMNEPTSEPQPGAGRPGADPASTQGSPPTPAPTAETPTELPAWRRALALAEQIKNAHSGAQATPRQPLVSPDPAEAAGHSTAWRPEGLRTLVAAMPQVWRLPVMELMVRLATADGLQLLRAGDEAICVLDPRQGWLVSGVSLETLVSRLQTPGVNACATLTPIEPAQLEDALHQIASEPLHRHWNALDHALWELAGDALKDLRLEPRGDLSLRLRRFPNFTRLSRVGPLDIQLATICARASQSLADLVRAFPGKAQEVYRFALLTSLCGAAAVQGGGADARRTGLPMARPAAAQRGFFKSLLDRLF